jgi:Holliday junction resolvasome RuvABC endonuclease subunit
MKTKKTIKPKKALKRLTRIKELLSKVIDQYAPDGGVVLELLDSAKTSIVNATARATSLAKASSASAKAPAKSKSPAKAKAKTKTAGSAKKSRTKAQRKKAQKEERVSRELPDVEVAATATGTD